MYSFINSLIIFSIYLVSYKILKLFNISNYYISLILLIFLSFNSIYQLLFLLRSEALSVLLFLISNYFFLKYLIFFKTLKIFGNRICKFKYSLLKGITMSINFLGLSIQLIYLFKIDNIYSIKR